MSTWKLTKKLKETHLSPFQRSSSNNTASGSTSGDSSSRNSEDQKRDSLNLPSITAHSTAGSVTSSTGSGSNNNNTSSSRSNTLLDSSNGSSSHRKSPSKTITNESVYQNNASSSTTPQPTPIPATTSEPDQNGPSTSTITPGLLTVSVGAAHGLTLPPSHQNAFGGQGGAAGGSAASTGGTGGASGAGGAAGTGSPAINNHNHNSQGQNQTQQLQQARSGGGGTGASGTSSSPIKQSIFSNSSNSGGSRKRPPVYIVLDYDKTQVILDATSGTIEGPAWDKSQSFDVSRAESLSIQIYVKVPINPNLSATGGPMSGSIGNSFTGGTPISVSEGSSANGSKSHKRYEDVFLGSCKVNVSEPETSHAKITSIVNGWLTLTSGSGKVNIKVDFTPSKDNKHLTIDDFDLLKVIGKGSFGKVMQVRKRDTERVYALKTIRKAHIVSRSEVNHTLAERTVLAQINNPFIVPLKFSFQSPEKLYLVLAFVNGGELFHHLQREGRFDLNRSRFYTAELLCALECLHEYNVIYRDLKPENILLDYTGHIALCDFGLCKLNMAGQEKTNTFCGTPEYLAPELLLGQGYSKVVDWWTLGVLFYEMLTGLPPFYDQDTNEMYRKILQDPLRFPDDMDREARSLLQGLLNRDPKKRLGVNGATEIKTHPFFAQIDWRRLMAKKYAAPFKPAVESATDTSNFDKEFTSEEPTDSVVDKDFYLSDSVQQQFGGWTYTNVDSKLATSGRW